MRKLIILIFLFVSGIACGQGFQTEIHWEFMKQRISSHLFHLLMIQQDFFIKVRSIDT